MSRAYRIAISESASHVIRAEDSVSQELDLLEILPCGEMAGLLADQLAADGFEKQEDGSFLKSLPDGVELVVQPETALVTVRVADEEVVTLEKKGEAVTDTDYGQSGANTATERGKARLREEIAQEAEGLRAKKQQELTDKLERSLDNVKDELNRVVNRTTAEALKRSAASLGQITSISEDPATDGLTLVVEV